MALYDPVNGVYRKVTKLYDPVDGVHRNVAKAFDPVDGVYRQYFSSGVPWKKYNCTKGTKEVNEYVLGEEVSTGSGTSTTKTFTGYTGYTFDNIAGTVSTSGSYKTISRTNRGTVYKTGNSGKTLYIYSITLLSGNPHWTTSTRTVEISDSTVTVTTYTCGSLVGTVYAAEGERPDAANGYTYVTVYNGYTIMKDPSTGKFYAYLQEE